MRADGPTRTVSPTPTPSRDAERGPRASSSSPSGARPLITTNLNEPWRLSSEYSGRSRPSTTRRHPRAQRDGVDVGVAGDDSLRGGKVHLVGGGRLEIPHPADPLGRVEGVVDAADERDRTHHPEDADDRGEEGRSSGRRRSHRCGLEGEAGADRRRDRGAGPGCRPYELRPGGARAPDHASHRRPRRQQAPEAHDGHGQRHTDGEERPARRGRRRSGSRSRPSPIGNRADSATRGDGRRDAPNGDGKDVRRPRVRR